MSFARTINTTKLKHAGAERVEIEQHERVVSSRHWTQPSTVVLAVGRGSTLKG